jgi:hypothetical protein
MESRKTGLRLRWRRRIQGSAACVAGIGVIAAAPVFWPGVSHRPSATSLSGGSAGTAYVLTENGDMLAVNLATLRAGRPVDTGRHYAAGVVAGPGGKTLYLSGEGGHITPVSTATGKVGRQIRVTGLPVIPDVMVGTPNGKFGYAISVGAAGSSVHKGIAPIDLTTDKALKFIPITGGGLLDGYATIGVSNKTIAVVGFGPRGTSGTSQVDLINVASQHAQKPIILHLAPQQTLCAAVNPDGRTAYVVAGTKPVLVPIDVATNRPLSPISVPSRGLCSIAVAPNGRTAYVLAGQDVTPVDLLTGKAEKPIKLGLNGPIFSIAVDPDGRMAYALGIDGVTPVDLATNTALPTIGLVKYGGAGLFLSFTPNGRTALVVVGGGKSGTLLAVQAATGKVRKAIRLSGYPYGLVVTPWAGMVVRTF